MKINPCEILSYAAGGAVGGTIVMTVGHAVLEATGHSGLSSINSAAAVGAVGGTIVQSGAAIICGLVVPQDNQGLRFAISAVGSAALSGVVGTAVLQSAGHAGLSSIGMGAAMCATGTGIMFAASVGVGLLLYGASLCCSCTMMEEVF